MEIIHLFEHALSITFFVYVMMMVVEYLNIITGGKCEAYLCKHGGWQQYIWAGLLGVIPGCMGAFAAVTLYSHRIFSLGAIVTVMIATSGDESFVMLAMFPGKAIQISLILLVVGIMAGYIVDKIIPRKKSLTPKCDEMVLHKEEALSLIPNREQFLDQLRQISFSRMTILMSLGLFVLFMILGEIGPAMWDWKRITFTILGITGLWIVLSSPQHFLDEHLWAHITKKHLPAIFGWTFGALLIIGLGEHYFQIEKLVTENELWVMLSSVIIGIIPDSGPHLLFVTLFAKGTISFLTLLVSSIVQDGHGMLPLLAFSRVAFLKVKLINVLVGLIVGLIGFGVMSVL